MRSNERKWKAIEILHGIAYWLGVVGFFLAIASFWLQVFQDMLIRMI